MKIHALIALNSARPAETSITHRKPAINDIFTACFSALTVASG
jgi:hypothetical protein